MAKRDAREAARRRKRRQALFGRRALDVARFEVVLSFGKHHCRADAEELAREIELHRPDIYVQETADLPEEGRVKLVRELNRELSLGRKDASARRQSIERARASGADYERDYSADERRVLLDSPGLRLHFVEGYSQPELSAWRSASREIQDARAIEAALLAGDLTRALQDQRARFERFAEIGVRFRNERIAAGLSRMPMELAELFPELFAKSSIRVLARFGSAHLAVEAAIARLGMTATISGESSMQLFSDRCLVALSEGEAVVDDELLAAIFQSIHSTFCPEARDATYAEWARDVHDCYQRLGGAAPFRRLLALPPGPGGTMLLERLRATIRRAAG